MKNTAYFALFFCCVTAVTFGQAKPAAFDPAAATKALKVQVALMGQAFLQKDYKTFCKYSYPKLLTMIGGEAKMIQAVTQAMEQMKAQGFEVAGVSYDNPTSPIKSGSEWQSTVPQHTTVKMKDAKITATSTLLAFSADNGRNWTFLDTSNKDIATIRKIVPGLSPSITIPPPQQPVRSAN